MRKIPDVNKHIFKQPGLVWSIGGDSISSEAQAVLDRLIGLTNEEESYIATFVDAEVSNGNWALIDEFFFFPSGLIGFKSLTATNQGGTLSANGIEFDGSTQYLQSGFIASSHGGNYSLNNALVGGWIYDNQSAGANDRVFGAVDGVPERTQMYWAGGTTFRCGVNQAPDSSFTNGNFVDKESYYMTAEGSNATTFIKGGNLVGSAAIAKTTMPTTEIYIGARNNNGSDADHWDGIISTFVVGASIGFNHSEHHSNIETLLSNFGVAIV